MNKDRKDYDAIVIGSGPNGLAAAITMQKEGLSVLLIEGKSTLGGGMRSAELTLPGYIHDICSAIHPMAATSPFLSKLPLNKHGLEYIYPELAAAHPFDEGTAAILTQSIQETSNYLGNDKLFYQELIKELTSIWPLINKDVLGPLSIPSSPIPMAKFGLKALTSANSFAKRFESKEAKGLWAGMAAHSILPLEFAASSAIGLVLLTVGHRHGWPIPKGGTQKLADALVSYFKSLGGKVETNNYIKSFSQLPSSRVVLFDTGTKQLLEIAGHKFSKIYNWQLKKYQYGMGVYKVDYALDGPVPFTSEQCRRAGTVHIGNTLEEIALSENLSWKGKFCNKPFVLLAQPSVFDNTRAPQGKHTVWAYCHTPAGSTKDYSIAIENQIERYAPGFKNRILAKHTMSSMDMQEYNPNYVGGDINGGALNLSQIFTRPALRLSPYRTSARGIYLCSASTPPGGGVHGMCGYHAAKTALKDEFGIKVSI